MSWTFGVRFFFFCFLFWIIPLLLCLWACHFSFVLVSCTFRLRFLSLIFFFSKFQVSSLKVHTVFLILNVYSSPSSFFFTSSFYCFPRSSSMMLSFCYLLYFIKYGFDNPTEFLSVLWLILKPDINDKCWLGISHNIIAHSYVQYWEICLKNKTARKLWAKTTASCRRGWSNIWRIT